MLLGCIADDFTGATDLANMLVKGGMRTLQTIGVADAAPRDVDARPIRAAERQLSPLAEFDFLARVLHHVVGASDGNLETLCLREEIRHRLDPRRRGLLFAARHRR